MSFGGVVGVFEKQEVHVVFSFASGAAIFHREPFATLFEGKNVYGYGGVEFFEKGDLFCLDRESQPLNFERVFVIFVLRQTLWVMVGGYSANNTLQTKHFSSLFVRQKVRHGNERGAVQRTVRLYGQEEPAHTFDVKIRSPLIPLLHLVVQVCL